MRTGLIRMTPEWQSDVTPAQFDTRNVLMRFERVQFLTISVLIVSGRIFITETQAL